MWKEENSKWRERYELYMSEILLRDELSEEKREKKGKGKKELKGREKEWQQDVIR